MSFTNVLFWIILCYCGYYAGIIAFEYYKAKKMGTPVESSREVFNPQEELANYLGGENSVVSDSSHIFPNTTAPAHKESTDDFILPIIQYSGMVSADELVARFQHAAERGDEDINREMDELDAIWSIRNKISA